MNMNQDFEHLKLLSIFHYVVAAVAALFACIPFIHFFVGLSMVTGWLPDSGDEPPIKLIGAFFMVVAGAVILCGWAFAICLATAGRYLSQHRSYTFCLVMAAIACMFMPFGTVLGVFTIIVLVRPSVKALFFPENASA
jgi:hypothetical protein